MANNATSPKNIISCASNTVLFTAYDPTKQRISKKGTSTLVGILATLAKIGAANLPSISIISWIMIMPYHDRVYELSLLYK